MRLKVLWTCQTSFHKCSVKIFTNIKVYLFTKNLFKYKPKIHKSSFRTLNKFKYTTKKIIFINTTTITQSNTITYHREIYKLYNTKVKKIGYKNKDRKHIR